MGSGAVKVLSLLSSPLPLLHPHRTSAFLRLSSLAFSSYRRLGLLSDSARRSGSTLRSSVNPLQTQTLSGEPSLHDSFSPQPEVAAPPAWPEWARLVRWLTDQGYVSRALAASDGLCDDFVERGDLPEEFVRVGDALILFARENPDLLRCLSKKEIGIVVDSGSAFLFKDGESSIRRLRNFAKCGNNDAFQAEKAETVDLVRLLLSYASKFANNSPNVVTDASVKNLLVELVTLSGTAPLPNFIDPNQSRPLLQQQDQFSTPPAKTISMKPGDWFCPKCNFTNFARNTKCLECSERKPMRILTGKEWECPQCNFFNYGKNMSCLRCDCKRPEETSLPSTNPSKTSTLEDILNKSTFKVPSNVPIKDQAVSQMVDRIIGREPNKTSWESLANQRQEPGHVPFTPLPADMFAKSKTTEAEVKSNSLDNELPEMMPVRKGENRFVVSKKKDRSLTSPKYKRRIAMEQANDSNSVFVPFVPFPADYFAKKRENNEPLQMGHVSEKTEENNKLPQMGLTSEKMEEAGSMGTDVNTSHDASSSLQQRDRSEYRNRQVTNSNSDFGHFVSLNADYLAKNRENNKLPQMTHMSEKTEETGSMGSDINSAHEAGDSSPQRNTSEYRKRQATSSSSDFGHFVPFPPDYFAKNRGNKPSETRHVHAKTDEFDETRSFKASSSHVSDLSAQQRNKPEYSSNGHMNLLSNSEQNLDSWSGSRDMNDRYSAQRSNLSEYNDNGHSYPKTGTSSSKDHGNKSLEGSSNQEHTPLDMSEEAKAERWFKRAAQIKHISELENIPDEDFPEIMPMRKGVNRFVVSKRKTPLERRLTSSQYRRNIPSLKPDAEKD